MAGPAVAAANPAERARDVLSWVAVPVGLALLLARPWLAGPSASLGLMATFAALAGLSLAGSAGAAGERTAVLAPENAPRLHSSHPEAESARSAAPAVTSARPTSAPLPAWAVAGMGVAAVAVAAAAGSLMGPAVPIPGGPAVLALVVGTAIAEEAFFRRLLYGRLERWGAPIAVVGSAVLFGALHVPLHGVAALPVDLGAGLFLSWQRWASGGWAAPAATHALANVVAVLR